jgi:hypothetical protein
MPNSFEQRIYYIYESPLQKVNGNIRNACLQLKSSSRILDHTEDKPGYIKKGPMNFLEIKQYVMKELAIFYGQAALAQMCDSAGLSIKPGDKVDSVIPPVCTSTFTNFSTKNLKNLNTTPFTSQFDSTLPPFTNFEYTASETKQMCQQYKDIEQLLKDFSDILSKLGEGQQKTDIMKEYNEMIETYNKNKELQGGLTNKLDNTINGIYYNDSKQFLDSTVYVSVLWTILATTGLFYIFRTMK